MTGGYSLWTKVRRKGKGPPWPGGPGGPLGTLRRWFLRGRGGGPRPPPPPLAEARSVHRGYGPPGRCFRRVPPKPPGHNKACTPPLFTEGLPLAPLHFCQKLRGSDTSEPREGRGDSGALRGTTRRWSFPGSGRGRRPSASLCGNAFGIAYERGIPGRCFRESRRHPRAQSKRSSQNNGSK